jgi:chromosome segregation ATPase
LEEKQREIESWKEQHLMEKDKMKYDSDREVVNFKSQISEYLTTIANLQQRVQQKDTRIDELDNLIKELKSKCQDLENTISIMQNKLLLKDSKYSEVEALSNSQVANLNHLKQKISEQEMSILSLQSKLLEAENKSQRQETALGSATSTITSLEQRIHEFKLQIDSQSDLIKKLDREKRDLNAQYDESEHNCSQLTKELRQLKDQSQQLSAELTKVEQKLSTAIRDAERDLQTLEEKHKLQLSKEISERDAEISHLRSDNQYLKQNSVNELNRVKADYESHIRDIQKEHQEELKQLSKSIEEKVEQTRVLQLKHKDDLAHLTMDLKQEHQVEIQYLKSKNEASIEILKSNISEANQKVTDLERDSSSKASILKQKEMEVMKLQMDLEKLDEDLKRTKAQLIVLEETNYSKIKQYERELNNREESFAKIRGETDSVTKRNDEMQGALSTLQEQLSSERENAETLKSQIEDLNTKAKEAEARYYSEIGSLKSKIQDADKSNHQSLLQIERLQTNEKNLLQSLEKLTLDFENLGKKSDKQLEQIQSLLHEKQNLVHEAQHLQEQIERKAKEIEILEHSIHRMQNSVKEKESAIQELSLKNDRLEGQISQLQHNTIIYQQDIEEAKQAMKKLQEEERDALKKLGKEHKKRLAQDLEALEHKLATEAKGQVQKLSEQHLSHIQKLISEHDKAKDSLNQQLAVKSEQLATSDANIKSLAFDKKMLQDQVKELDSLRVSFTSELEDKSNLIIQLKERIKDLDRNQQSQNAAKEQMLLQLDQLQKSQQVSEENLRESKVAVEKLHGELSQSLKRVAELESQLLDHSNILSKHDQQQRDLEEQTGIISTLEGQILGFQRLLSKETKFIASMQLTILELASMVNVNLPWNMNDIMNLPEKIKVAFKMGKPRAPFDSIDPNVLLEVVHSVREELALKNRCQQELQIVTNRCNDLEKIQSDLHTQLNDASNALAIVEERIHNQDTIQSQERDVYRKKLGQLEKALEKALHEVKVHEQKSQKLSEQVSIIQDEKQQLEKDFIELYERLQTTKQAFLERSKTISADTALLLEQYNETKRTLEMRELDISKLNDMLATIEKENKLMALQKERTEKLLKDATENTKNNTNQLSALKSDREKLQFEKEELQKQMDALVETKNREIESLLSEYEHTEQKILRLGESVSSTARILEEFKDKWNRSLQREKELENRNQILLADMNSLKAQLLALQENQSHPSSNEEVLSLQAQLTDLERSYARIKKDKIILEQEVILLRTKQQMSKKPGIETSFQPKLPDPRNMNLIPHPNDFIGQSD